MSSRIPEKSVACVYTPSYLGSSKTFVHRQLVGLTRFTPVVLCKDLEDPERFPLPNGSSIRRLWGAVRVFNRLGQKLMKKPEWRFKYADYVFFSYSLKSIKPDVLHVHFGNFAVHLAGSAKLTNTPMVVTFHGHDATRALRNASFEKVYGSLLSDNVTLVAVSDFIKSAMVAAGAPEDRIIRSYIGVPLPEKADQRRDPSVVLQVCRFVEKKGLDTTIEAFASAAQKNDELRLVLVGDGPLRSQLEAQVAAAGIAHRVTFTGDLTYDDVTSWYRKAGIFIHPSVTSADGDQEGLPTAIIEAMGYGLPVLATHHAGIAEAVTDDTGVLVQERDAAGLADAILALCTDPARANELGDAGRARAEQLFDVVTNTLRLEEIYLQATNRS